MLANCASAALVAIVTGVSSRNAGPATAFSSGGVSLSSSSDSAIRWHATLAGVAAAGLLSFGVRALRRREGRAGQSETLAHSRLTRHTLFNAAAVAQTAAGVGLAWLAIRSEAHHRHLASWHGWIGSAATLALVAQCTAGFLLRYRLPAASKLRLAMEFLHAASGGVTFGLASAAVCSGLFTDWFLRRCPTPLLLACVVCLHLIGMRVFSQIWKHYF